MIARIELISKCKLLAIAFTTFLGIFDNHLHHYYDAL